MAHASPEYVSGIDLGLGQKDVEASYVVKAIAIATNMGKISTSTPSAIIHFTTDGSLPSLDSPVYSNSMFLTTGPGIVVKAIVFAAHMSASPVAQSVPYVLAVFEPVADPNGGQFD